MTYPVDDTGTVPPHASSHVSIVSVHGRSSGIRFSVVVKDGTGVGEG